MTKYKGVKRGWRVIGGRRIYMRSMWESNFARWLQYQVERGWLQSWGHETKTFWFAGIRRGVVSFLPDFQINRLDGGVEWVEVKGYMDNKSKTKIKRFAKYYPKERLTVIDKDWFSKNNSKMKIIIKEWE